MFDADNLPPDLQAVIEKAVNDAYRHGKADGQESVLSGMEAVRRLGLITKAAEHAPAGGATIAGTDYRGGQFIPAEEMEKATPEEKAALEAKKAGRGDDGAKPAGDKAAAPKAPKPGTVEHTVGLAAKLKGSQGKDRVAKVRELATALEGHSHKELAAIKAQLGIRASGPKAELARKVAERHFETVRSNVGHYTGERLTADDAHAAVTAAIADGSIRTPEGLKKVAAMLTSRVSAKDLRDIKQRLGVKASGPKWELAQKVAERAGAKVEAPADPDAAVIAELGQRNADFLARRQAGQDSQPLANRATPNGPGTESARRAIEAAKQNAPAPAGNLSRGTSPSTTYPGANTKPEDIPVMSVDAVKPGSGWEGLTDHALYSSTFKTRAAALERAALMQRGGGTGSPYEHSVVKTASGWKVYKRRHGKTLDQPTTAPAPAQGPTVGASHPDDAELAALNRTPAAKLTKEQRARKDQLSREWAARKNPGAKPVMTGGGPGPGASDAENEGTVAPKPFIPRVGQFNPETQELHRQTYDYRAKDVLAGLVRAHKPGASIPDDVLTPERLDQRYGMGMTPEDVAKEVFEDFVKPRLDNPRPAPSPAPIEQSRRNRELIAQKEQKPTPAPSSAPAAQPPTVGGSHPGHANVADELNAPGGTATVADLRGHLSHLSDEQFAAGINRLVDAGRLRPSADDQEFDGGAATGKAVRAGSQSVDIEGTPFSLLRRRGDKLTADEVAAAFGGSGPGPQAAAAPPNPSSGLDNTQTSAKLPLTPQPGTSPGGGDKGTPMTRAQRHAATTDGAEQFRLEQEQVKEDQGWLGTAAAGFVPPHDPAVMTPAQHEYLSALVKPFAQNKLQQPVGGAYQLALLRGAKPRNKADASALIDAVKRGDLNGYLSHLEESGRQDEADALADAAEAVKAKVPADGRRNFDAEKAGAGLDPFHRRLLWGSPASVARHFVHPLVTGG